MAPEDRTFRDGRHEDNRTARETTDGGRVQPHGDEEGDGGDGHKAQKERRCTTRTRGGRKEDRWFAKKRKDYVLELVAVVTAW